MSDPRAWYSAVLYWPVKFLGTRRAHPCLKGSRFVHWCAVVLEQEGAMHKAVPTKLGAWNYSKCLVWSSIKSSFQPRPTPENPSPHPNILTFALQASTHAPPGNGQTQTRPLDREALSLQGTRLRCSPLRHPRVGCSCRAVEVHFLPRLYVQLLSESHVCIKRGGRQFLDFCVNFWICVRLLRRLSSAAVLSGFHFGLLALTFDR